MKIRLIFGLLFATTAFAQSSDFTQNFGAVPPINRGQIVKMSSTGQVVPMLTTDTTGAIGIATTSTTSSNVLVTLFGAPLVAVDGSCTPGNVVLISTIAAGQGHCASAASNQVIGIATTVATNGFATIQLAPLSSAGASGVAPNNPLPASSSGPGPVFNVKNYGAKGDTQSSANCTLNSATNLNCTDVTFTSANVNNHVSCTRNDGAVFEHGDTDTFTAFVDAHNMTVSRSQGFPNALTCLWGTPDDTAVSTALTAALAQVCSKVSSGNLCTSTSSPTVYFPSGAYNLFSGFLNIAPATGALTGFAIKGDGAGLSKIYWHANATNAGSAGLLVTGNIEDVLISGLTLDGGAQTQVFTTGVITNGNVRVQDVTVQRFSGQGWKTSAGIFANRLNIVSNGDAGFFCNACAGEIYESVFSNNTGSGMTINGVFGLTQGSGLRLVNSLFDENGSNNACDVIVQNSMDVWFQGVPIFGSTSGTGLCGLSVDGTSFVHWSGGLTGPFGSEFPKNGVTVSAGGILQASDVRFVAAGTGKCITNSGILNDNGGNSCETVYAISSGTSTGTTAVLTLASNTVNVSTNCAVGDALIVEGAGIAGYNGYYPAGTTSGITAVTATTLTYTTAGSNLGALSAGGNAYCRNLITYSGTLPKALLNNPIPNTCYITGTFAATTAAAPMCAFKLGSATNVSQIKATSTTTTACTVAPVVTISDGTVSETLTITTGKSIWDSSVDASTGVGTSIFKPNGTITLSNTVGTCTTPPTNFSVSYNISPIFSN